MPSKACLEMNCIGFILALVWLDAATVEIWGKILPIATRHERLQASPSDSASFSSSPILAGAQDFRYPVHCMTLYFLSIINLFALCYWQRGLTVLNNFLPEFCCFLLLWHPVVVSASSLTCAESLHFILQKNDLLAPGQSLLAPCGTSVFTGNIARMISH